MTKNIKKFDKFAFEKNNNDPYGKIYYMSINKYKMFVENKHKDIDPYGEEIWNDKKDPKTKLIAEIKELVEKYGGCITMMDMQADYSPTHAQYGDEPYMDMHLIERIYNEHVEVVVYGGYKMETEIDEYDVPYEEVSLENLIYIKRLLDQSIESELLEEDI